MAGNPENAPGRNIKILGKEVSPETFGLGGVVLVLAGIWAANQPYLGLSAMILGLGVMEYGRRRMG
jgi:hypothetical protein